MADSKRNSATGKIATPKVGAQTSTDQDSAISKAVGGRIRINLTNNEVLEGTLFTACPVTNVLAINTAPPPPNPASNATEQPGDYHIIPISRMQSFQLLSLAKAGEKSGSSSAGALSSFSKPDLSALRAREEAAVKKLKEVDAKRGRGVSKEAQEVFNHINRTLPARWHESSIIVNDLVTVKPPYRPEDASAQKGKHIALDQVKKVLNGFADKKKREAQGNSRPVVATPTVPRKGG